MPQSITIQPLRGGRSRFPVADIMSAAASVFAAAVIAFAAAFLVVPDVRPWLAAEDGLVAWVTTAALWAGVALSVWGFRRATTESRFRLVIPAVATAMLLQNLRFGAGALGIQLPVVAGVEIGSLLDLRELGSVTAASLGLGAWTATSLIGLVAGCSWWGALVARRWADDRARVTDPRVVGYLVATIAAALVEPATGFYGDSQLAWFCTMMTGLVGSGLLIVTGIAAADHRTTVAGWRRRMWAWIDDDPTTSALAGRR